MQLIDFNISNELRDKKILKYYVEYLRELGFKVSNTGCILKAPKEFEEINKYLLAANSETIIDKTSKIVPEPTQDKNLSKNLDVKPFKSSNLQPIEESISDMNIKEKIRNLKDGEIMIISVPSGRPVFDKLKIKKNPKHDNVYTLWNVDEEGNVSNEVKFSSLNNAAYWAAQGELEGISLEEAAETPDRYKVSRYSRFWYGIKDDQTGLLLRVGPNADYSKPLDEKENKLLLFHSKEEAQSYIDANLNQKLRESTMNESKNETVDIYYDDLEITVVTKRGNPSGYYSASFGNWLPDDDETREIEIDYDYEADWDDVYDVIWDNFVDESEAADMSDEEIEKHITDNFDDLAEKYIEQIKDHFRDDAREEAEEKYADDYLYESTSSNPYIFKDLKEAAESDIKLKDFWEDVEQPVEEVENDFEIDTKLPYEGMEDDDPVLDDLKYGWNDIDMEAAPEGNWEEVASKDVFDADGFLTTYKWFKSVDADGNEKHIFMFNEDEADPDYADYECESEAEAREHFNSFRDLDADNSIDALKEFISLPEGDKPEEVDYDDQLEEMHKAAVGEDAKNLREGFMSDFDIDIQEIGGKEAMALKLEKEIAALEAEMSFLTDIAPREIGAGGAFDNKQEIAEAKKATQKELDLKRAKLGLLRG